MQPQQKPAKMRTVFAKFVDRLTHDHRFFTCEVCEPFKQEHPDIFAFVQMQRPRWVFFPMAYQHKDTSDLLQVWLALLLNRFVLLLCRFCVSIPTVRV